MNIRDRIKDFRRVLASSLRPSPKNWRTHPKEQQDALKGILAEIGYAGAVIARELPGGDLELIDGHLRVETTPNQKIPVLVLDVTEEEAAKILATMDPLGAMAGSDNEKLTALLAEVGTENDAVQALLDGLASEHEIGGGGGQPGGGGDEFDATPEEQGETRAKVGDLWVIGGKHRLLVGDCTVRENVERLMGGGKADLVVTSPPYNQKLDQFKPSGMHNETKWVANVQSGSYYDSKPESSYQDEQSAALRLWSNFLTKTASLFYNHKNRYRDKQVVSPWIWISSSGAKVRQEIIWKREGSVTQNARMFMPCDERVFWLYFEDDFYFDDRSEHKTWSSVWSINSHKDIGTSDHGCAFPMELPSRCIAACSKDGQIVFEPYCGSGTTLIAAHRLNRICYGCEIEPRYADVILKRAEAEGLTVELDSRYGETIQTDAVDA